MYVCVCVCACACVGREGGRGGRREKGLSSAASPQDSPNLLVCTLAVMDILPRFTCRRRPFSGVPSHSVRERKKSSRTSLDLWKTQAYGTTDVRTCLFRDEKTQLETTWTSEIWLRPCVGAIEKLQTPPSPDVSWKRNPKEKRKGLVVVEERKEVAAGGAPRGRLQHGHVRHPKPGSALLCRQMGHMARGFPNRDENHANLKRTFGRFVGVVHHQSTAIVTSAGSCDQETVADETKAGTPFAQGT